MAATTLTSRDYEALIAFFKVGTVDWEVVSSNTASSTAKYARDKFGGMKKKLNAGTTNLSDHEKGLLRAVAKFGHFTVDYEKMAKEGGFKTAKYARDTFAGVRKKLGAAPAKKGAASAMKASDGETILPSKEARKKEQRKIAGQKRKGGSEHEKPKKGKKVKTTSNIAASESSSDDDEVANEKSPYFKEKGRPAALVDANDIDYNASNDESTNELAAADPWHILEAAPGTNNHDGGEPEGTEAGDVEVDDGEEFFHDDAKDFGFF